MPKEKKEEITKINKKNLKKEIKEEVVEEITEDLLLIIEKETKNKLDKMETKIYRYKKRTILKKNIIILLLLIILVIETKIIYDNNLIQYINNNEEVKITNNKEQIKDNNWYIENYSYLLDKVKTNLLNENAFYLYEDNYKELTIKNSIRLNMAYQQLSDINNNTGIIEIPNQELKKAYYQIFGNNNNYSSENFENNCLNFIYNKNRDSYLAIDINCPNKEEEITEKIINITEKNNNIIIETIAGIYNPKNKTLSKIDKTIVADNFNNDNLEEYQKKLNKYKYTFKNNDNDYYLTMIEKIN